MMHQLRDRIVQSMNMRDMRHQVISSNLANSETPGFKSKRFVFEDSLERALGMNKEALMQKVDKRHYNSGYSFMDSISPSVVVDYRGEIREDGNSVSRDKELVEMNKNRILYEASAVALNKKLGLLKYAISSER